MNQTERKIMERLGIKSEEPEEIEEKLIEMKVEREEIDGIKEAVMQQGKVLRQLLERLQQPAPEQPKNDVSISNPTQTNTDTGANQFALLMNAMLQVFNGFMDVQRNMKKSILEDIDLSVEPEGVSDEERILGLIGEMMAKKGQQGADVSEEKQLTWVEPLEDE